MAYTVIRAFADLYDGGRVYIAGDTYPRDGLTVTKDRMAELSSTENRRGEPLIKRTTQRKKSKSRIKGGVKDDD